MVRCDDIIRGHAHRYRAERLRVAQLVEHSTFNAGVEGSYPSAKTTWAYGAIGETQLTQNQPL